MNGLESHLEQTAQAIDWPSADLWPRVAHSLTTVPAPRKRSLVPVLAAVAVIVIAALVLIPTTRSAIADLFGMAGIRIEFGTHDLPPPSFDMELGRTVTMDQAVAGSDITLRLPAPDAVRGSPSVHVSDQPIPGEVVMAWAAGDDLPEIGDSGIGLLISQFRATRRGDYLKRVEAVTNVRPVSFGGHEGLWLAGDPHLLIFLDETTSQPVSRLAANVLMWEDAGITYRIESNLDLDAALEIALSLVPAG